VRRKKTAAQTKKNYVVATAVVVAAPTAAPGATTASATTANPTGLLLVLLLPHNIGLCLMRLMIIVTSGCSIMPSIHQKGMPSWMPKIMRSLLPPDTTLWLYSENSQKEKHDYDWDVCNGLDIDVKTALDNHHLDETTALETTACDYQDFFNDLPAILGVLANESEGNNNEN
jgi:hypothetical protein